MLRFLVLYCSEYHPFYNWEDTQGKVHSYWNCIHIVVLSLYFYFAIELIMNRWTENHTGMMYSVRNIFLTGIKQLTCGYLKEFEWSLPFYYLKCTRYILISMHTIRMCMWGYSLYCKTLKISILLRLLNILFLFC